MSDWNSLLLEPAGVSQEDHLDVWFTRIAEQLLNSCRVLVGKEPHRFTEIEFYYNGDIHPDKFTHRDPLQLEVGRWYFHRTNGVYRGGSFKGFDLTFAGPDVHGGILIRGLETSDGTLIDGPSLCVDHLLAKSQKGDVAALDNAIAGRKAWDATSPLFLEESPTEHRGLLRTARVGLSLKRSKKNVEMPRYIMRPYRYLSEPRRISKGKPHMVLALHAQGVAPDAIYQQTGCTRQAIGRYIADFEAGRQEKNFDEYFGIDLGPRELGKLHGTWHVNYGKQAVTAGAE